MPVVEPARLLTVAEVCQLLRISRWTLYQLFNRSELRSITIGRRRLVTQEDLQAFLRTRREDLTL